MATINVLDSAGLTVALEKPLAPSRAAAASSRPVVLSTEDKTAIDALATQTTLAAVLAKLSADPATQTTLAAIASLLTTQAGYLDGIEALIGTTNGKDFATQTTLAAVLAKLTAAASSIAKAEDAASADLDVGVPAMAIRKATPANTSGTDGDYEMLQMSAGRLWISALLEAGSALIGKVGIDQTTPGTTNAVAIAAAAGTRVEATITTGGTAQLLFSATPTNGFEVINTHATETLYIRENGTATVADNTFNIPVPPKGFYVTPTGYKPTGDVSVIAATTAHGVIGRRW